MTNTVEQWLIVNPPPSSESPWHWRDSQPYAQSVVVKLCSAAERTLARESQFVGTSPTLCKSLALALRVLAYKKKGEGQLISQVPFRSKFK